MLCRTRGAVVVRLVAALGSGCPRRRAAALVKRGVMAGWARLRGVARVACGVGAAAAAAEEGPLRVVERRGVAGESAIPRRSAAAFVMRGWIAGFEDDGGAGRALNPFEVVADWVDDALERCERADEARECARVAIGLWRFSSTCSGTALGGSVVGSGSGPAGSASVPAKLSGSGEGDLARVKTRRSKVASTSVPFLDWSRDASGLGVPLAGALPRLLRLILRRRCCSSRASTSARAFSIAGESRRSTAGTGAASCFASNAAFERANGFGAASLVVTGATAVGSSFGSSRQGKRISIAIVAASSEGAVKVRSVGHSVASL